MDLSFLYTLYCTTLCMSHKNSPHTIPLLRIQVFFFFLFHLQTVLSVSHTAPISSHPPQHLPTTGPSITAPAPSLPSCTAAPSSTSTWTPPTYLYMKETHIKWSNSPPRCTAATSLPRPSVALSHSNLRSSTASRLTNRLSSSDHHGNCEGL